MEAPERVTSILEQLKLTNLLDSLIEIQPGTPSRLIPELVHRPEYVDRVEQKGIKLLIPIWSDSIKFGYQDLKKWEETYNWMKKNEFLENDFNINDFIYTKYSNQ